MKGGDASTSVVASAQVGGKRRSKKSKQSKIVDGRKKSSSVINIAYFVLT
jgi:hypothetical protein